MDHVTEDIAVEREISTLPPVMPITLFVNGREHRLEVETWITLLDTLRENLGLTGTKKGCDHGQCGACTVLVNGRRINSCLSLAATHDCDEITTVEGLACAQKLDTLQSALIGWDAKPSTVVI